MIFFDKVANPKQWENVFGRCLLLTILKNKSTDCVICLARRIVTEQQKQK